MYPYFSSNNSSVAVIPSLFLCNVNLFGIISIQNCTPRENRTLVFWSKTKRPSPLDDRGGKRSLT